MFYEYDYSACALGNLEKVKALNLKQAQLRKQHVLPCGCEKAPLREFLSEYTCSKCRETYFYSFCLNEIVNILV